MLGDMSAKPGSVLLAVVTPAVVLSVCGVATEVPAAVTEPSVIGVIEVYEQTSDGALLTLEGGETVLLPPGSRELTGPVETGRLLIVGEGGPGPLAGDWWYSSLRRWPSGCFEIASNGEVRGERLALSEGFSVPLSDEWNETEVRFVDSPAVGFCLDSSGEAVRTYS